MMESNVESNKKVNDTAEQESFQVVEWNIRPNDSASDAASGLDNSCGCDCGCSEMA
jgi:hypothetical protein